MPHKASTKCIHSGIKTNLNVASINTPIYTSTSYLYNFEEESIYPRRLNTPNLKVLAEKIASLENGKYGFTTSSGMAAISAAILAIAKTGDHVLIQKQIYGGTQSFISKELERLQINYTWFDIDESSELNSLIKAETKIIYIETPSNPLLSVIDIELISKFAREHDLVSIIDNTFATPINQQPLEFGIDIVVHSGSKYLCGHSDILCGAIVTSSSTIAKSISQHLINYGPILDAYACALLERSIKTLALRMERHNSNAMKIAKHLITHSRIVKVNYPGLEHFAYHEIAAKQMYGFGGMVSFELDGDLELAKKVVSRFKLFTSAMSLGGVESLSSIPRLSSHSMISAEERQSAGIKDSLIRLSVGIEDIEDLINDIDQALG